MFFLIFGMKESIKRDQMRGERCGKMTQYDYVQRGRQGSPMQCGHMATDGHVFRHRLFFPFIVNFITATAVMG